MSDAASPGMYSIVPSYGTNNFDLKSGGSGLVETSYGSVTSNGSSAVSGNSPKSSMTFEHFNDI
jgi:hypothetical protein